MKKVICVGLFFGTLLASAVNASELNMLTQLEQRITNEGKTWKEILESLAIDQWKSVIEIISRRSGKAINLNEFSCGMSDDLLFREFKGCFDDDCRLNEISYIRTCLKRARLSLQGKLSRARLFFSQIQSLLSTIRWEEVSEGDNRALSKKEADELRAKILETAGKYREMNGSPNFLEDMNTRIEEARDTGTNSKFIKTGSDLIDRQIRDIFIAYADNSRQLPDVVPVVYRVRRKVSTPQAAPVPRVIKEIDPREKCLRIIEQNLANLLSSAKYINADGGSASITSKPKNKGKTAISHMGKKVSLSVEDFKRIQSVVNKIRLSIPLNGADMDKWKNANFIQKKNGNSQISFNEKSISSLGNEEVRKYLLTALSNPIAAYYEKRGDLKLETEVPQLVVDNKQDMRAVRFFTCFTETLNRILNKITFTGNVESPSVHVTFTDRNVKGRKIDLNKKSSPKTDLNTVIDVLAYLSDVTKSVYGKGAKEVMSSLKNTLGQPIKSKESNLITHKSTVYELLSRIAFEYDSGKSEPHYYGEDQIPLIVIEIPKLKKVSSSERTEQLYKQGIKEKNNPNERENYTIIVGSENIDNQRIIRFNADHKYKLCTSSQKNETDKCTSSQKNETGKCLKEEQKKALSKFTKE